MSTSCPPVAKAVPKAITVHDDTRVDDYFWLRDRTDPDVIRYLDDENRYTNSMTARSRRLRAKLYTEILGRIKETDVSVPVPHDNYYYYTRTRKGRQYPIYCRKKGSLNAPEQILLDANKLAKGRDYFQLGNFSVSPNHRLLAYSTDGKGDETFTIFVKDLATGKLLTDRIENTSYSLEWANDNRTFFYTMLDAAKRPHKIFRHTLGEAQDELIYHEEDQRFNIGLAKSRSNRFLYIHSSSAVTSEVRALPADKPAGQFRVLLPRRQEIEYDVADHGGYFYIRTNDGAKGFRLVRAPIADPSKPNWKEVLPGREGVTIEGVDTFRHHLVVYEREEGLLKIRIQNIRRRLTHYVAFPEPVYTVVPAGNARYETNLLRFSYTSLVTPSSVFDYHMDTRRRSLKKQQPVRGYRPERYASERILATAPDGVRVPISLVYRKDTPRDGSALLLLYGYGSYGLSMEPAFSSDRLSLLDRGFIFAIAHVRGGGDLGKQWHDAGKLLHKKNTFTDFIACAEHLLALRYTSPERLAIIGGSAGGLLVGAVLNIKPELFHAAVAKVPFVDVLNTILDPTLPLTVSEYEEWGNPADKVFYDYIKSYSPYDNVDTKRYPILLITAGLNDPRVSYWEPAKWAAKLRARKQDNNLLLLKTNMDSGHFGASGRYEHIKEVAFDYAFIINSTRSVQQAQRETEIQADGVNHSYRKATMGSTGAARRAGR